MSDDVLILRKRLADAEADLTKWEDRFDNYSGNNPDKFKTDIRLARLRVASAKAALAAKGPLR
jgi:hypothetical protein